MLWLVLDKIPRNHLAEFLFSDFTENAPLVQYTFTVFAILLLLDLEVTKVLHMELFLQIMSWIIS